MQLKHSLFLWDGPLAKLGLGCKLLEQLMNFGDASIFITTASNSEQFSELFPYFEGSIMTVISFSQNSLGIKWKPFLLLKKKKNIVFSSLIHDCLLQLFVHCGPNITDLGNKIYLS